MRQYLKECEKSHLEHGDKRGADAIARYIETGKGKSAAVLNAIAYAKQQANPKTRI